MVAIILATRTVIIPTTGVSVTGWYIGVGAGHSDVDSKDFSDDIGNKLFMGYNFNENLALEGGYGHGQI